MMAVLALGALSIAALLPAGCKDDPGKTGGPQPGQQPTREVHKAAEGAALKLAFVSNNADPFWNIAKAGVQKYEQESGLRITFYSPPNAKVEEQNQYLENLLSQGYHGVAISVIAPADQSPELNRAAKKLNVVCVDSDAPTANRIAYIGTNNYEAGKLLGQQIVKQLPDGGKIAVFVGTMAADNARERHRGVVDATKDHKIEVVKVFEDNKDEAKARKNVEDAINSYPDVKLMCGLWAYNGPAIASALNGSGKKGMIKAAVFDESDGTLDGIEDGTIACTVVQKPYEFGYQSSKLLHALATKGKDALPANPIIDTGAEVIDSANVKKFRDELRKLKGG